MTLRYAVAEFVEITPEQLAYLKRCGPFINREELAALLEQAGPEQLVNRRSTSWRSLSSQERELAQTVLNAPDPGPPSSNAPIVELMLKNQTMIKRPVLIAGKKTLCGFDEAKWSGALCF